MSRLQHPGFAYGRASWFCAVAALLVGCTGSGEEATNNTAAAESMAPPSSTATALLTPSVNSGYTMQPGRRALVSVGVHCGVRVFPSKLNGYAWETTEGEGVTDWVPSEWPVDSVQPDGPLTVEIELSTGGDTLTLTKNGRSVTYQQSGTEFRDDQLCA
jgi:hypothetical protein